MIKMNDEDDLMYVGQYTKNQLNVDIFEMRNSPITP